MGKFDFVRNGADVEWPYLACEVRPTACHKSIAKAKTQKNRKQSFTNLFINMCAVLPFLRFKKLYEDSILRTIFNYFAKGHVKLERKRAINEWLRCQTTEPILMILAWELHFGLGSDSTDYFSKTSKGGNTAHIFFSNFSFATDV